MKSIIKKRVAGQGRGFSPGVGQRLEIEGQFGSMSP
jgi:hypothetical protein